MKNKTSLHILIYIGLSIFFAIDLSLMVERSYCYLIPFFVLLSISVLMIVFAKFMLKTDSKIIAITSLIMTVGIFVQALTFSVTAPVRTTLNMIYETACSEELIKKYPDDKKDIEESVKSCQEYSITPENAKKAFQDAAIVTHIDILDRMAHLEDEKDRINNSKKTSHSEENSESEESSESEENSESEEYKKYKKFYEGVLKDDNENKHLTEGHIKLFRSDNNDFLNVLGISEAKKLAAFMSGKKGIPNYKRMAYKIEENQRMHHAINITANIILGFCLALWGMVAFSVLYLNLDIMTILLFIVQIAIMGIIAWKHRNESVALSYGGINFLETIKVFYILIMASLLGKKNKKNIVLLPHLVVNRIWCAFIYNILTAGLFVLCSEMGTMTTLLFTGVLITVMCVTITDLKEAFFPNKYITTISVICILCFVAIIVGMKQVYMTI